jgi:hypothetical protein
MYLLVFHHSHPIKSYNDSGDKVLRGEVRYLQVLGRLYLSLEATRYTSLMAGSLLSETSLLWMVGSSGKEEVNVVILLL